MLSDVLEGNFGVTMNKVFFGDCRDTMRDLKAQGVRVQCCVTSPPYFGLRAYGDDTRELGRERTPAEYVAGLVEVFDGVRELLADDGVLFLNIGDGYAGYWGDKTATSTGTEPKANRRGYDINARPSFADAFGGSSIKPKDMLGIPWRVAFALQDAGWYLRQEIIWHKPTHAPEGRASASRFTRAHESLFMMTKRYRYKFKDDRRLRSVWDIEPAAGNGLHFATFPDELPRRCIEVASAVGDLVLDPFHGIGTTGRVAESMGRGWVACELYEKYGALHLPSNLIG